MTSNFITSHYKLCFRRFLLSIFTPNTIQNGPNTVQNGLKWSKMVKKPPKITKIVCENRSNLSSNLINIIVNILFRWLSSSLTPFLVYVGRLEPMGHTSETIRSNRLKIFIISVDFDVIFDHEYFFLTRQKWTRFCFLIYEYVNEIFSNL